MKDRVSRRQRKSKLNNIIRLQKKKLQCKKCLKEFSRRSGLTKHGLVHSELKAFECKFCGCKFKQKWILERHKQTHRTVKRRTWSCENCSKSFGSKSSLTRHHRIHQGVKPFTCTQCSKSFVTKFNLLRHQRKYNSNEELQNSTTAESINKSDWEMKETALSEPEIKEDTWPKEDKQQPKTTKYIKKSDWEKTMTALSEIEVKGDTWPKQSYVCWRTLPPLIKDLCRLGIVPKAFITTGKHWNPFFYHKCGNCPPSRTI